MKKRLVIVFVLVAVLMLVITSVALAKTVIYNLDGVITAIVDSEPPVITIYNETDGDVTVTLPLGYVTDTLAIGYTIHLEGIYGADSFVAEQVEVESNLKGVVEPFVDTNPEDGIPDDGIIKIYIDGIGLVTVHLPVGFALTLADGDTVLVEGIWVEGVGEEEGYFEATFVEVNPEVVDEIVDPGGRGGIWCDGGKEKYHPVAKKIAEMNGWVEDVPDEGESPSVDDEPLPDEEEITPEWVMEQFCAGFGFGEIMLARRTQALFGDTPLWDTRYILSLRNEMGWGQIWKFLELKNNSGDDVPPPGQLKKPDDAANQPPGWANKPDKENKLRGWEKNQNKGKGPKNK